MEATKYTLSIEAEALDIRVFESLLAKVIEEMSKEVITGDSWYADGDHINWHVASERIEF